MLGVSLPVGWAQQPKNPEAEGAIVKNAEGFIEAFHKGDARALAAFLGDGRLWRRRPLWLLCRY